MNRRFRLFLFGFIIGIIVVILVYGEKSNTMFKWTPEGRIQKRLKLTEKIVNDSLQCILDCNDFNEESWSDLYENGDVNFARARNKPFPIYSVTVKDDDLKELTLTFSTEDELSILIGIEGGNEQCNCP